MKIAIIGSPAPDSLELNLCETFRFHHHECQIFDIYDRAICRSALVRYAKPLDWIARRYSDRYDKSVFRHISRRIIEYAPDLVIGVYRFIHPSCIAQLKQELKCKIIHVNPDALTTFEAQQIFASDYDVWFTKDPYIVKFMRENMHLNAKLYNEAFSRRHHIKPNVSKLAFEQQYDIDVMTYGTMYPYRCRMLKAVLDAGVNLKVYGVKPNRFYDLSLDQAFQNKYIVGEEKSNILYGAKVVFNQMHFAEIESVNNRFFEVNGSGAFQLSDYRPILHNLLPIDPELVSFRNINDGIEKIKYYLAHPQQRADLANTIYNHFTTHYSYDNLIEYILYNID